MNKVLEFPKSKIVRESPPNEAIIKKVKRANDRSLEKFSDDLTQAIMEHIYEILDDYEYNLEDNPSFDQDFKFLMEAVRCTVYRLSDLKHPMHELVDNTVKIMSPEEYEEYMSRVEQEKTVESDN